MSGHWRECCCDEYPAGAKCWSLSFSPKHLRYYDVDLAVSECESACGPAQKVTATVALGAWRAFGTQKVIIGTVPEDGCDCTALVCELKDYTVPSTWTAALEFCSADCAEGTGAPGAWRVVSSTNLVQVVSTAIAACGPPGFTGIEITFTAAPPAQTLTACGRSAVMESVFGHSSAPKTEVRLRYCRRPGTNGCILDLYSVTVGSTAYSYAEGAGGIPDDCACDPGIGPNSNLVEVVTGTIAAATEYAGGFGTIYALAGSPPTSITCRECAP